MSVFSIFSEKGNQKAKKKLTAQEYYLRLARAATAFKYGLILLLVVFVAYCVTFKSDEITLDNFKYIGKVIDVNSQITPSNGDVLYFDADDTNRFGLVRGDLAVANSNGVSVYMLSGSRLLKSNFKFDCPVVLQSEKNVFVYDLGGTELKIFSSYANVHTQSYSYPILGAAVNEKGTFAVISSERGYRSALFVYDEHFRPVYRQFFGEIYLTATDINEDGTELITAAVKGVNGENTTVVNCFSVNEEQPLYELTVAGEFPWKVSYGADGGFSLLTDKALRIYNADKECLCTVSFEGKTVSDCKLSDEFAILSFSPSSLSGSKELAVYSTENGQELYRAVYPKGLKNFEVLGDKVYALSASELSVFSPKEADEGFKKEVDEVYSSVLPVNEGYALVLSGGSAEVVYTTDSVEDTQGDGSTESEGK